MVSKRRAVGFSLVELLIAMAIMSMTLVIASTGYSFFMDRWQSELGQFDKVAGNARKLLLLNRVVSGIYAYVLVDKNKKAAIYFEGNQDSLLAITKKPLTGVDRPFAIRLSVEQNDDFTYNVIYESASLDKMPITSIIQPLEFSNPIQLMTGLDDVKFFYFGHSHIDKKFEGETAKWWETFNSLNRQLLPQTISMAFTLNGEQQQVMFPLVSVDRRALILYEQNF